MINKFWLISTDHLENSLWFKDEEDFKAGMNFVAILAAVSPVLVMTFSLMSNHVHFVLQGARTDAEDFVNQFKKQYAQYCYNKYGTRELLRRNRLDIKELRLDDESFERAVAYVQMNPVAANICIHPTGYNWGTGNTFFNMNKVKGTQIKNLGVRESVRLFHRKAPLPGEYVVSDNGIIDPASYIPVKFVESVFKSPNRMNYFLTNSSKAKRVKEAPSFNDQLVSLGAKDICISVFKKKTPSDLTEPELSELFKQLRYRFSADPAQIARVTGFTYQTVATLLEKI